MKPVHTSILRGVCFVTCMYILTCKACHLCSWEPWQNWSECCFNSKQRVRDGRCGDSPSIFHCDYREKSACEDPYCSDIMYGGCCEKGAFAL